MEIKWSDKIAIPNQTEFRLFVQGMANRLILGNLRYGAANKKQKYLDRLAKELKVYKQTGNMENLINIANYAHLESYAPQNKKFHFDPTAKSATRIEELRRSI